MTFQLSSNDWGACSKLTCFTTPHTIRVHESFTCYLVCHPYVYIVQSFPDKSCLIKIITSCLNFLPSTRAYFFTLNSVADGSNL